MTIDTNEISCKAMARYFSKCADYYPVSDRYLAQVHDSSTKTGKTEKEHMVAWFRGNQTKGSGAYSRSKGNKSARACYQNLCNAASLLWIAEAVGIDNVTVEAAYADAVAAGDYRRACGAIRKSIPWEAIYDKVHGQPELRLLSLRLK